MYIFSLNKKTFIRYFVIKIELNNPDFVFNIIKLTQIN